MNSSVQDFQDLGQNISEYAQRNAPTLVFWAACAALLITLILVVMDQWDQRSIKVKDYAAQNVTAFTANAQNRAIRSNIVTDGNLFGDSTPRVVTAAPQTTLNLTLKGILSANSPTMARAIIQSGTDASKLYSVGDNIRGSGANVEEIKADEVLLNRSGAIESLKLKKAGNRNGANIEFTSAIGNSTDDQSALVAAAQLDQQRRASDFGNRDAQNSARSNRAARKSDSPNGPRRSIKRPTFSGLDKAIDQIED